MALQVGSRLGHYEVTALIGEGGMGQVYQATDTKLKRQVALKILPEAFSADPERLARFQREAEVLASLNHPNIAAIHGLEEADDIRALVLELVEGPTLADRIKQGPIPLDEALPIAKQIAEALEAAHEAGVIHRDLKPANIKVRDDGTVKVLDFGLAKAFQPDASDPSLSQSPTISLTAAATQLGMVIGTAAYMAPEQAKGLPVDKRADIWAFGAVLFEMLTGRKLFDAGDVSEMLASVLVKDPDISSMGNHVPDHVRSLVRRCLVKDPRQRMRDIGDVRLAMEGTFSAVSAASEPAAVFQPRVWQRPAVIAAALVVTLVAGGVGVWGLMRSDPPRLVRFAVLPSDGLDLRLSVQSPDVAISPDGRQLVYLTGTAGQDELHVRSLDQLTSKALVSEGALRGPFFSPDSRSVAFSDAAQGVLKRIAVEGGPTVTICELPGEGNLRALRGASWGANGSIIFGVASGGSGLWRVPAVGGEPEQLTTPAGAEQGEVSHYWPEILPGGESVLFAVVENTDGDAHISVLSLDTLEHKRVIPSGTYPRYSPTGHLLYVVEGNLWAVRFDLSRLETVGDAVPVQQSILTKPLGAANFDLARDGSLVYVSGSRQATRSLVRVSREGQEEALDAEPGNYTSVRVSPDGGRLALDRDGDIWTYDTTRGTFNRVTTDAASDYAPVWTRDGARLIFGSERGGSDELFWTLADGTGTPERIASSEGDVLLTQPEAVTPDGTTLLFSLLRFGTAGATVDIAMVSLEGDGTADLLIEDEFITAAPAVSPDGRWITYDSNLSGRVEVYVQRFPGLGDRRRLSRTGGRHPRWSPDGRELFYQSLDGRQVLSMPITTEPTFSVGEAEILFGGDFLAPFGVVRPYDVTPDGKGFVIIKTGVATGDTDDSPQIILVLNWFEELTRLVPTN